MANETGSLDVLKALGDNTRYAIYLELARRASPQATADIAASLDLHVNTVRPHLERMRDVGLLEVHSGSTGVVGRPQHRYSLRPDAPSLGLEPPLFPKLARALVGMAVDVGADADDARQAGSQQGRADAGSYDSSDAAVTLLVELDKLGFDPQVMVEAEEVTITFGYCPFSDLARTNSEIVCGIHHGMVEGFVDELGHCEVRSFRPLSNRNPCQVVLADSC